MRSDFVAAPAPAKAAAARRKAGDFAVNDYVVYPTHGVGRIRAIEEQEIAGLSLTLFVVEFEKEKMTLRVPIAKASATGMRKLSSPDKMKSALQTLKGRARVKRTMWSRRAQEYEAKINSGDPVSIAEVVVDGIPKDGWDFVMWTENGRSIIPMSAIEDAASFEHLEAIHSLGILNRDERPRRRDPGPRALHQPRAGRRLLDARRDQQDLGGRQGARQDPARHSTQPFLPAPPTACRPSASRSSRRRSRARRCG